MTDFFQIVSQFGFPIAVTAYLLFRYEKKLEELRQSVRDLEEQVRRLVETCKDIKTTTRKK